MTKNRLEEINQRIRCLREYVAVLHELKPLTIQQLVKDKVKRGAVERYLQLAAEVVLDIANLLIAEYRFRTPTDYTDSLLILGEEGVLDKDFARTFSGIAGFRNILVHDYIKIDYRKVAERVNRDLEDFSTFAKQVSRFLT